MMRKEQGPIAAKSSALGEMTGSSLNAFSYDLLNRTIATLWRPGQEPPKPDDPELQAMLAAMAAFKPKDEIEGMLAAQAVALNAASLECLRRAMIPNQPVEVRGQMLKHGANLARAFTDMLDAIDRKRGKHRKQVVRVEKVTVQAGGQAIVGNVAPALPMGGGGADGTKTEEEPHATRPRLAHDSTLGAVLPPLRGADAGREPVPVASDAERPLPPPRRR